MNFEIDLRELLSLLKRKFGYILFIALLCGTVTLCYSIFFIEDYYTSDVSMYVLMRENKGENYVTYSDINASQMLVNDISSLVYTKQVQDGVCRSLRLENLDDFEILVTAEQNSRVATLSVVGNNPSLTTDVANELVTNISSVAENVLAVDSINIVDHASLPDAPSGPNRVKLSIIGFGFGAFISAFYYFLSAIFSFQFNSFNSASQFLSLPEIGQIPTFMRNLK